MSAIWVLSSSPASRVSISEMTPWSCSAWSCWFMVIQPVWRHGLEIEALAKHTFCAPLDLNAAVSVISPSMYCSHGWSAGPSKVASRCSIWRSKSAWTNHSLAFPVPPSLSSPPHPASSASAAARARAALAVVLRINFSCGRARAGLVGGAVVSEIRGVGGCSSSPGGFASGLPGAAGDGHGDDHDHALDRGAELGLDDLERVQQRDQQLEREGAGGGREHPASPPPSSTPPSTTAVMAWNS